MQIADLHNIFLNSSGVTTDTRADVKDKVFFALKGPTFNGNEFANKALDSGATHVVIDEGENEDARVTKVDDALQTLQELASFHRDQFDGPVIGLTGSNGKTTTKELMREVLSTKYETLATMGNLNNHIGVPLTLLEITNETEMAIIEMGANHVGEIAFLCSLAKPTHGLITNIGKAHIGTFGGFENIIRGKSELFDYLIKNNGIIWVNTDDPVLDNMSKRITDPRFYPLSETGNTFFEKADPFLVFSDDTEQHVTTKLVGHYNFSNVASAKAVGREFGITDSEANAAIADYSPSNNRSQVVTEGDKTIILDAYNANPSSMKLAVENFIEIEGDRAHKLMILGDMLELGKDEKAEHTHLGEICSKSRIDTIYVGELSKDAHDSHEGSKWFSTKAELLAFDPSIISVKTMFLIKGSRGIALESVVDWISK